MLGLACWIHAARACLLRRAVWCDLIKTKAKIVALERTSLGDEGPDLYTPVVQFVDKNGARHEARLLVTSDLKTYRVNRSVPIFFQHSNPANLIDPNTRLTDLAAIVINLGLGLLFMGLGLLSLLGLVEVTASAR